MRAHNLLCLVFATFRYFYCNFCQLVWHDEEDKQAKEFLTPQTSINSVLPTQCPQRVPLPIPGCGSTGPEQCNMPNVSRNLIKHFLRLFVYTDIPSLSPSSFLTLPLSPSLCHPLTLISPTQYAPRMSRQAGGLFGPSISEPARMCVQGGSWAGKEQVLAKVIDIF